MARAQVMSTTGRSVTGVQTNLRYVSLVADKALSTGTIRHESATARIGLGVVFVASFDGSDVPDGAGRGPSVGRFDSQVPQGRLSEIWPFGHASAQALSENGSCGA